MSDVLDGLEWISPEGVSYGFDPLCNVWDDEDCTWPAVGWALNSWGDEIPVCFAHKRALS